MVYLVSGVPVSAIVFSFAVTGLSLGVGLLPLALLGLPVLSLTLQGCRALGAFERARVSLMLGEVIPAPGQKTLPEGGWLRRWMARLTDSSSWRQLAGALVLLPLTAIGYAVAVSVWSIALALIALPAYNLSLIHILACQDVLPAGRILPNALRLVATGPPFSAFRAVPS